MAVYRLHQSNFSVGLYRFIEMEIRVFHHIVLAIFVLWCASTEILLAQSVSESEINSTPITIKIDPSYQHPAFEGWGTSLVWFANATGGYPEEIRQKLVNMVFGTDGLRLNIARYNIGGGNAPDVRTDYMKLGATMEGFWKAPPGTTQQDKDWWNPDNPNHWNWNADANQRWWLEQIKDKVSIWEAFSNSPPWFQTISGYVSGGFDPSIDQIRSDKLGDFARYLLGVVHFLEENYQIKFRTIEPFNEANTSYWGTQLGEDGQPIGGRQEGAHAGPELQQEIILALQDTLENTDYDHLFIAAMDETNPETFRNNWNSYNPVAKSAVGQLNVHTYGTESRTSVRDIAKAENKTLWMSEVEGSFHSPTSYTSMEPGLGIATRMIHDLRELEPAAWVLWQPIEDTNPQLDNGGNWGSIHIPFNCTASDTLETCPIRTNTKFDTIRQFTHYIRPGDQVIKVNDPNSLAVSTARNSLSLIHVNNEASSYDITIDLSKFAHIAVNANYFSVITSNEGRLMKESSTLISGQNISLTIPPKSVSTIVMKGVYGVARHAPLVQPGHHYRIQGVASGLSLAPNSDNTGVVIRHPDTTQPTQIWRLHKLSHGFSNKERYIIENEDTATYLMVQDHEAVLREKSSESGEIDAAGQWILSTTGDDSWTLVNVASGRLLDVYGQATRDGSRVSTWIANSGDNQRWNIVDETALAKHQRVSKPVANEPN